MRSTGFILADIPGFGRVADCGRCGNLHVSVGPVSLTLAPDAYMQLVALLNTSAANFETWTQANAFDTESDFRLADEDPE
jgi:hypothetical protein